MSEQTPEQALAAAIRQQRHEQRISARQLAERIQEQGGTLTRQAISKIETGGRGIGVDDLFMISQAFKLPPHLLLPQLLPAEDPKPPLSVEPVPHICCRYEPFQPVPSEVRREQEPPGPTRDAPAARLWTHRETAEFLSISETQLFVLNRDSEGPPSYKIGHVRRYDPAEVRAWLQTCRSGPKDQTDALMHGDAA